MEENKGRIYIYIYSVFYRIYLYIYTENFKILNTNNTLEDLKIMKKNSQVHRIFPRTGPKMSAETYKKSTKNTLNHHKNEFDQTCNQRDSIYNTFSIKPLNLNIQNNTFLKNSQPYISVPIYKQKHDTTII